MADPTPGAPRHTQRDQEQATIEVVTCEFKGWGKYTVERGDLAIIMDEMDGATDGDEYTLRFHRMPTAEYDALPEFEGW